MTKPVATRRAISKALALAAAGVTSFHAPIALAQTAGKQMRIIVPFPPGGGTDMTARLIASKLADITGMPVVADNRTGASGTIGIAAAAKLPPDGLNLVLGQADNLAVAPLLIKGVPCA